MSFGSRVSSSPYQICRISRIFRSSDPWNWFVRWRLVRFHELPSSFERPLLTLNGHPPSSSLFGTYSVLASTTRTLPFSTLELQVSYKVQGGSSESFPNASTSTSAHFPPFPPSILKLISAPSSFLATSLPHHQSLLLFFSSPSRSQGRKYAWRIHSELNSIRPRRRASG